MQGQRSALFDNPAGDTMTVFATSTSGPFTNDKVSSDDSHFLDSSDLKKKRPLSRRLRETRKKTTIGGGYVKTMAAAWEASDEEDNSLRKVAAWVPQDQKRRRQSIAPEFRKVGYRPKMGADMDDDLHYRDIEPPETPRTMKTRSSVIVTSEVILLNEMNPPPMPVENTAKNRQKRTPIFESIMLLPEGSPAPAPIETPTKPARKISKISLDPVAAPPKTIPPKVTLPVAASTGFGKLQHLGELCENFASAFDCKMPSLKVPKAPKMLRRQIETLADSMLPDERQWYSTFPLAIHTTSSTYKTYRMRLCKPLNISPQSAILSANEALLSMGFTHDQLDHDASKIRAGVPSDTRSVDKIYYDLVDDQKLILDNSRAQMSSMASVMKVAIETEQDAKGRPEWVLRYRIPVHHFTSLYLKQVESYFKKISSVVTIMAVESERLDRDHPDSVLAQEVLRELYEWQQTRTAIEYMTEGTMSPFHILEDMINKRVGRPSSADKKEKKKKKTMPALGEGIIENLRDLAEQSESLLSHQTRVMKLKTADRLSGKGEYVLSRPTRDSSDPIEDLWVVQPNQSDLLLECAEIFEELQFEWGRDVLETGIFEPPVRLDEYNAQVYLQVETYFDTVYRGSKASARGHGGDRTAALRTAYVLYLKALRKFRQLYAVKDFQYRYFVPCAGSTTLHTAVKLPQVCCENPQDPVPRFTLHGSFRFDFHTPHWVLISVICGVPVPQGQTVGECYAPRLFDYPFNPPSDLRSPFQDVLQVRPDITSPLEALLRVLGTEGETTKRSRSDRSLAKQRSRRH